MAPARQLFFPLWGPAIALCASLSLCQCGGGQTRGHPLDSSWSDEDGTELGAFEKEWRGQKRPPKHANVAIGVVDDRTLIGRALGGGHNWRYAHELVGRPVIAGTVVVGIGGGALFALAAETGEVLWRLNSLGKLRGASDDGQTTLVSLQSLTGTRSIVLAIDRDGDVVRQLYLEATIGDPVIYDAFAFLPWNERTVVIFDLVDGTEAARVVSSSPVSHAFTVGGDLYFGERTAFRFDEGVVEARRGGGTRVALPQRSLPDEPRWHIPGNVPLPLSATRRDSVRYYARPTTTNGHGDPGVGRYMLGYHRLIVGLDGASGATEWAHLGPERYIGGWLGDEALAVCDVAGTIRWLDRTTGVVVHGESMSEAVVACAVQSELAPETSLADAPPLDAQLARAISAEQRDLVPMQLELLADLANVPGPRATSALIELGREGRPFATADAAREVLASRRSGLDAIVHALAHDDGGGALPLAAMAEALRNGLVVAAAPLLARELNASGWSPAVVAEVAATLESIATPQQREALVWYLARLGCDPDYERASLAVARALARLGGGEVVGRVARVSCGDGPMAAKLLAAVEAQTEPVYRPGPTER